MGPLTVLRLTLTLLWRFGVLWLDLGLLFDLGDSDLGLDGEFPVTILSGLILISGGGVDLGLLLDLGDPLVGLSIRLVGGSLSGGGMLLGWLLGLETVEEELRLLKARPIPGTRS